MSNVLEKPKGKKKVVKIETKEKEITKMKASEILKKQFVEFSEDKKRLEKKQKEIEEQITKIRTKFNNLAEAIELLESIGM